MLISLAYTPEIITGDALYLPKATSMASLISPKVALYLAASTAAAK